MDLRQLRYFVAVVETGSLSKAAIRLHVSQPSLSQQIAGMESDLKVGLLHRSPTGMRPTDAGLTLYHHARTILQQFELMRDEVVNGENSETGQVAVGLPTSIASVLSVPLFNRVKEHYPSIQLQLFENMSAYLVEMLAHGHLNMAILFREAESRGVSVEPMFREHLHVFGAAQIGDATAPVCPAQALSGIPLVLPGKLNGLRTLIERTFARERIALNVVADMDSLPSMLTLAAGGKVATILSGALMQLPGFNQATPDKSALLSRRIIEPKMERIVSLCVPDAVPQNAASRAVEETIRILVRELPYFQDKLLPSFATPV